MPRAHRGRERLPINGDTWQVMRLSRNRNWAHPAMVGSWSGYRSGPIRMPVDRDMVGDIGQPRGGPIFSGHASHQIGLDADIWLTPMPDRRLSREEREEMSAVMMVRADRLDMIPSLHGPCCAHPRCGAGARRSAHFRQRRDQEGAVPGSQGDRSWLSKVRPLWGHDYHFHIRMSCPPAAKNARASRRLRSEGCGAADFAYWFKDSVIHPPPPKAPPKPGHR